MIPVEIGQGWASFCLTHPQRAGVKLGPDVLADDWASDRPSPQQGAGILEKTSPQRRSHLELDTHTRRRLMGYDGPSLL